MIQRIQTLWLLLAVAAGVLSIKFPFYTGHLTADTTLISLTGTLNIPILLVTILCILLSVVAIFMYKKRSKQTAVIIFNIVISILLIIFYFLQLRQFVEGNFSLTSLFAFLIPIFLVLALVGVRKDERIIKSLNRLR